MAAFDFIASVFKKKVRREEPAKRRPRDRKPRAPTVSDPLGDVASTRVRPKFSGNAVGQVEQTLRRLTSQLSHGGDRLLLSKLLRALKNDGISLPAMPQSVLKIQRMLNEPDTSTASIAQAIACEPMVSAKFIAVANSPMYLAARPITALEDAVVRVGLNQTSMIVLAIVARSRLFNVTHFQREAEALYQHSLACGATCRALARLVRGVRADDAFQAGLLQEIGRVFVLSMAGSLVRSDEGPPPQRASMNQLADELDGGFSAVVAESWGYKEELVRALELHNLVGCITEDDGIRLAPDDPDRLTYLIAASDLMARLMLRGEDAADPQLLARRLGALDISFDEGLVCQVVQTVEPLLTELGVATSLNESSRYAVEAPRDS